MHVRDVQTGVYYLFFFFFFVMLILRRCFTIENIRLLSKPKTSKIKKKMTDISNLESRCPQATGIPVADLHCPPVWGFVGARKYVDVDRIAYHHHRDGGSWPKRCDEVTTTVHHGLDRDGHKQLRIVLMQCLDLPKTIYGHDDDDEELAKVLYRIGTLVEIVFFFFGWGV